jgi:uncharacterized protein (TIGR02246 family)
MSMRRKALAVRQVCMAFAIALWVHAGPGRADEVRAAVEAGNRAFVEAFLRGDAGAVAQFYTENAQLIAPGAPVARGRSAIASAWQKTIDGGVKELSLQTLDVESAGDLAFETGLVRLVLLDGSVAQGRYVVVWKREAGQWKLHRDIWNSES